MMFVSKRNLKFSAFSLIYMRFWKMAPDVDTVIFHGGSISENVTRVMVYIYAKIHASTYKPTIFPHICWTISNTVQKNGVRSTWRLTLDYNVRHSVRSELRKTTLPKPLGGTVWVIQGKQKCINNSSIPKIGSSDIYVRIVPFLKSGKAISMWGQFHS